MRRNEKKAKRVLLLIIILIVVLVLLVCFLKILSHKKVSQKDIDPKNDGVLNLSGFGIFFEKYSGDFKSSEIASYLEKLTIETIPQIYKDTRRSKDNKIEEYYNENKIKQKLGIMDASDFLKFINIIKNSKIDLDTWYRLDLVKETFENDSDKKGYAYIEYEVSFKNDDKLRFSLYVSKNKNKKPNYIINIVEN